MVADSENDGWALTAGEKLQLVESLPFGADSFLLGILVLRAHSNKPLLSPGQHEYYQE